VSPLWSQRARERIAQVRSDFGFLAPEGTTLLISPNKKGGWYTFAGTAINEALRQALCKSGISTEIVDEFCIRFEANSDYENLHAVLSSLRAENVIHSIEPNAEAKQAMKFNQCVPTKLLSLEIAKRQCSSTELEHVLQEKRTRVVHGD
jgi:hypothetical protein